MHKNIISHSLIIFSLSKNTLTSSSNLFKISISILFGRLVETNILYDSIHNASVLTGINEGSIGACCRNKQLYTLDNDDNKYHWQFENENAIGDEV